MFKISFDESRGERRLLLQGRLAPPWTTELESAWNEARAQPDGRKLIIDLSDVTLISADGEDILLKMMRDGAKFFCRDVLNRHILRRLAAKCRGGVPAQ